MLAARACWPAGHTGGCEIFELWKPHIYKQNQFQLSVALPFRWLEHTDTQSYYKDDALAVGAAAGHVPVVHTQKTRQWWRGSERGGQPPQTRRRVPQTTSNTTKSSWNHLKHDEEFLKPSQTRRRVPETTSNTTKSSSNHLKHDDEFLKPPQIRRRVPQTTSNTTKSS